MIEFSKAAVDRIGESLRRSSTVSEAELKVLQDVRRLYFSALASAEDTVRSVAPGIAVTSRLKTVQTIVEKLRREEKMRLSRMQDIAGVRLVADLSLREQDELGERILDTFGTGKLVDRRRDPSHGYRALHLYVAAQGLPVEVQVRTLLQDQWAQIVERLADRWGRQLRYGGNALKRERSEGGVRRDEVWDLVTRMSPLIAGCESVTGMSHGTLEPAVDPEVFCGMVDRLLKQLARKAAVSGGL